MPTTDADAAPAEPTTFRTYAAKANARRNEVIARREEIEATRYDISERWSTATAEERALCDSLLGESHTLLDELLMRDNASRTFVKAAKGALSTVRENITNVRELDSWQLSHARKPLVEDDRLVIAADVATASWLEERLVALQDELAERLAADDAAALARD